MVLSTFRSTTSLYSIKLAMPTSLLWARTAAKYLLDDHPWRLECWAVSSVKSIFLKLWHVSIALPILPRQWSLLDQIWPEPSCIRTEHELSVELVFLACVICTYFTVTLFMLGHQDLHQKYFLVVEIALSRIAGFLFAADALESVSSWGQTSY